MIIFLVLIRHLTPIANNALRSNCWIVTSKAIVDMWNRKSRRIGSCLGQYLYILLVFSPRLPYAVYSLCLVSVLYPICPITPAPPPPNETLHLEGDIIKTKEKPMCLCIAHHPGYGGVARHCVRWPRSHFAISHSA